MILTKNELDSAIKSQSENLVKLDLERNLLISAINNKEKEISEMEYLVLHKLPTDFKNFDFLFKKELEIHNKMKMENIGQLSKNEDLASELKEMIKIYKETAHIELEKTKEGYLKITFFKGIPESKLSDGASVVVEIKEGSFKIISLFPNIKITLIEEELAVTHNFTLFLTKLANEFIKYIK
jgi:hypothetical protein